MIHRSIRLYLRVEVIDDGSETKEGNFQRSQEQLRDAAEIPRQPWSGHMELQSCKKQLLPHHAAWLALPRARSLLRGQCRFSHKHWKLQAQALPYAWGHLSQQVQGCAHRSGRGNCCLAGNRLQIAQCSSRDTANLAIAAPSCSRTVSPIQNRYRRTFCSMEPCCLSVEAEALLCCISTTFKML